MRIAIVSDIHMGDSNSVLFSWDEEQKQVVPNHYYLDQLKRAARNEDADGRNGHTNDYLVLLRDIIDMAIVSYEQAFRVAKAFFQWITENDIAEEIIYTPGNHDFQLWHTYEYEAY